MKKIIVFIICYLSKSCYLWADVNHLVGHQPNFDKYGIQTPLPESSQYPLFSADEIELLVATGDLSEEPVSPQELGSDHALEVTPFVIYANPKIVREAFKEITIKDPEAMNGFRLFCQRLTNVSPWFYPFKLNNDGKLREFNRITAAKVEFQIRVNLKIKLSLVDDLLLLTDEIKDIQKRIELQKIDTELTVNERELEAVKRNIERMKSKKEEYLQSKFLIERKLLQANFYTDRNLGKIALLEEKLLQRQFYLEDQRENFTRNKSQVEESVDIEKLIEKQNRYLELREDWIDYQGTRMLAEALGDARLRPELTPELTPEMIHAKYEEFLQGFIMQLEELNSYFYYLKYIFEEIRGKQWGVISTGNATSSLGTFIRENEVFPLMTLSFQTLSGEETDFSQHLQFAEQLAVMNVSDREIGDDKDAGEFLIENGKALNLLNLVEQSGSKSRPLCTKNIKGVGIFGDRFIEWSERMIGISRVELNHAAELPLVVKQNRIRAIQKIIRNLDKGQVRPKLNALGDLFYEFGASFYRFTGKKYYGWRNAAEELAFVG